MSVRIHDDEPDTSEAAVRALLRGDCPDWHDASLRYVDSSGTSNALWQATSPAGRVGVVRLPRTPGAARSVAFECSLLPALGQSSLSGTVRIPAVVHVGTPSEAFPHVWAIFDWIAGEDCWTRRHEIGPASTALAEELAEVVLSIRSIEGATTRERALGDRGGPLGPLLERLDRWLEDPQWSAADLLDVSAIRHEAAACAEAADEPVDTALVHGDLIPGNILVDEHSRLFALIDWGSAGLADPAQDLSPAWSVFEGAARQAFGEAMDAPEAMWLRARAFDLEQAVGGVLYYSPRGHALADVMARTLHRLLSDPVSS